MTEENKDQSYRSPGDQPASRAQDPAPGNDNSSPVIETSREARNMAMLCHILGAVGFFAPLVIWLSEKDKHKFVAEHGQTAMNYQISLMIYYAVSSLLCPILVGFVLLGVLTIVHIVVIVMGAVKAGHGEHWRYPLAIQFLK